LRISGVFAKPPAEGQAKYASEVSDISQLLPLARLHELIATTTGTVKAPSTKRTAQNPRPKTGQSVASEVASDPAFAGLSHWHFLRTLEFPMNAEEEWLSTFLKVRYLFRY
jgi:hypothetical protein